MLGEIIGLALLGGAGYVGWRLAKGGSHLKLNPSAAVSAKWTGKPKGGYRITTLHPSFLVATFQQAEELVHELQPVLEELYPDGRVNGYTHSYGDFPFQTEEEMRKVSRESGPMKMVTKHTAQFGIGVDLETYEELRDELDTIMEMAQELVSFPLDWDHSYFGAGPWMESKPKKKTRGRNPTASSSTVIEEHKSRVAQRLLKQYSASAKRHLEKARKDNGLHIYGSPYGQFNVSYKDGVYTIHSKNDDTLNRVIAKGSSKEIVPVLVKLENDEWDAIPVEINIPLRGYRR